jgi:uncharacterized protein (TIGR03118 family)
VETAAVAQGYKVTPLVTDNQAVLAGLGYGAAPVTDPNLINPWGFDHSSSGPWVVANAFGSGTATSYSGTGQIQSPAITISQGSGPPFGPTGTVYSGANGYQLPGGSAAKFLFSNLDGSISGWDGLSGSSQIVVAGRAGGNLAAYTGLAIGNVSGAIYLYAANNITGNIDVFNQNYNKVTLAGSFVDPGPNPNGYLPFNVQDLSNHIWITYAVPGPSSDDQPLGSGFVSEFNPDGTFVQRFADGGDLSSPWGITIAPDNFGEFSNDVLIGNFNDDAPDEAFISAYDLSTGQFEGKLEEDNDPILLPGLWGLEFGNGAEAGPSNELYFTAGIGDEAHGLVGSISAVPEPKTWFLMVAGLGFIALLYRRRKHQKGLTA